ncbi:MAG: hypothetical protein PUF50_02615 [Erysipelotrichaceae bacterium]|nr:hypothetical protein [Erysipelotrichaceae bacterium]
MAKLKKMLGKIDDPIIIQMMKIIETQSKETLENWAIHNAEEHYLPIYETYEKREDLRQILSYIHQYLNKEITLKEVKPYLKELQLLARTIEHPASLASARAIATACSTIQTPTSALGFTFYGCAAITYHQLGLLKNNEEYEEYAKQELERLLHSLEAIAIKEEPHPVSINWYCNK